MNHFIAFARDSKIERRQILEISIQTMENGENSYIRVLTPRPSCLWQSVN